MEKLLLVPPKIEHKQAALEYRQEHFTNGENLLHGGSLFDSAVSYKSWLDHLKAVSNLETLPEGWVVSSTFFVIRENDNHIIGMVDIRHELNEFLRNYGGHIGYGVRPLERRKGYATCILMQSLDYCRGLGLDRVMLACNKDNVGSRKTILNCSGIFEREFLHTDGKWVQVFWIEL